MTIQKMTKTVITTDKKLLANLGKDFSKMVVKISLDDDCGNGHEEFSLTTSIFKSYETNEILRG